MAGLLESGKINDLNIAPPFFYSEFQRGEGGGGGSNDCSVHALKFSLNFAVN